jgi:hypothetical protein
MNLFDMARRNDKNLILFESVKPIKRKINNIVYRGFDLLPSNQPQIILKNIFNWYPFCTRTEITGWLVTSLSKKLEEQSIIIKLQNQEGISIATETVYIGSKPTYIPFPLPFKNPSYEKSYDLILHFPLTNQSDVSSEPIFLIVHRVLQRSEILSLCQGDGLEIGPGPNPQIFPSAQVNVKYIEQCSPETWYKVHKNGSSDQLKPEFWSNYIIGEANSLPIPDQSLDFIFSSHVFEHLANPVGHLEYWHTKLKPEGLILAIVPDVAGCKDYVFRPCPFSDLLNEYKSKITEPTLEHYIRYAKGRGYKDSPKSLYDSKISLHVHFYTNTNMAELLTYAVENMGYSWFNIRHTPNHKDFYFVLCKF